MLLGAFMKKRVWAFIGAVCFSLASGALLADTFTDNEQATAAYFRLLQSDPNGLLMFLQSMPKGGDLHNHRSGSAYAENMIAAGAKTDLCLDPETNTVIPEKNCAAKVTLKNLPQSDDLYNKTINAWSLRDFQPSAGESAHDHFFAVFLKYGALSDMIRSQNLTELTNRAGMQHEIYVETMITAQRDKAIALGSQLKWTDNFQAMQSQLKALGVDHIVQQIKTELTENETYMHQTLGCGTTHAQPGCGVTVRYQYIPLRVVEPSQVFAQLMVGFEVASQDPRVVAINLVGPEDNYISLRDYHLQMQMIQYFHQLYPKVHIDLHAGELTMGFVTPDNLTNHIRDAIETGHAERIGHGVDIGYEHNPIQLLQEMATKHIAVEICLTSNAQILSISGHDGQIQTYLQYKVPVVLATDDEGVLRTDLTHEFQRAVLTYHFDYPTIKTMVRNSLTYNFMPGESLWADPDQFIPVTACSRDHLSADKLSPDCMKLIQSSPKAALQWALEKQWAGFEKEMAATYRAQTAVQ